MTDHLLLPPSLLRKRQRSNIFKQPASSSSSSSSSFTATSTFPAFTLTRTASHVFVAASRTPDTSSSTIKTILRPTAKTIHQQKPESVAADDDDEYAHETSLPGPSAPKRARTIPTEANSQSSSSSEFPPVRNDGADVLLKQSTKHKEGNQKPARWNEDERIRRGIIVSWLKMRLSALPAENGVMERTKRLDTALERREPGWRWKWGPDTVGDSDDGACAGAGGKGKGRAADLGHFEEEEEEEEEPWFSLGQLISSDPFRCCCPDILMDLNQAEVVRVLRGVPDPITSKVSRELSLSTKKKFKGDKNKSKMQKADKNAKETCKPTIDIDLRLAVVDPIFGEDRKEQIGREDVGGWEVRMRKDTRTRKMEGNTGGENEENDESARTVYMENIPPSYQAFDSLIHLLFTLFPTLARASFPIRSIQPAVPSRGKNSKPDFGKIFVVFGRRKYAKLVREGLEWKTGSRTSSRGGDAVGGVEAEMVRIRSEESCETHNGRTETESEVEHMWEIVKGCRTRSLSMKAFEVLAEEYKSYRQQMQGRTRATQAKSFPLHNPMLRSTIRPPHQLTHKVNEPLDSSLPPAVVNTPSLPSYPASCLLFVRSVPTSTNKTELKSIFNSHLNKDTGEEVDYVDWQKGMDTAHVRLATPHAAMKVLQGILRTSEGGEQREARIRAELLQGKREEIYWMNLPEKIRRAAVLKMAN